MLIIPMLALSGLNHEYGTTGLPFVNQLSTLDLHLILTIFLALMTGVACISHFEQVLNSRITQSILKCIRRDLYQGVAMAQWTIIAGTSEADYARVMSEGSDQIQHGLNQLVELISHIFLILIYTSLCLALSIPLTLLAMFMGAVLFAITIPLQRKSSQLGNSYLHIYQRMYQLPGDLIKGLKSIKSSGTECRHINHFVENSDLLSNQEHGYVKATALSSLSQSIVSAAAFCLLFYIAIEFLALELPILIVMAAIFSRLLPQVTRLTTILQRLAYAVPSITEVGLLLQRVAAHKEASLTDASFDLSTGIHINDVSFFYPDSDSPAISHIQAILTQTGLVVLNGNSGIGKSTLAGIIAGIYLPTSGVMSIGNQTIDRSNLLAWRRNVTYVPQEPFLIEASIRENLCLLSNGEISDADLEAVLGDAGADFVFDFPQGLDTLIGEEGKTLSGGERQRLTLARALLNKRPVLVLDEITSQLDARVEKSILDTLLALSRTQLVCFISHREGVSQMADEILTISAP